jgi:hypothetical protein
LSEKVVWQLLRPYAEAAGVAGIALMANMYSLHDYIYDEQNAQMVSMRKQMGDARWLQGRLQLKNLDVEALESIPQTH